MRILSLVISIFWLQACASTNDAPEMRPPPLAEDIAEACLPISTTAPQYPIDAARRDIQGWSYFAFNLDGSGSATNLRVIDGEPENIFSNSAGTALSMFRFEADAVEKNCTYIFNFRLR